MNFLLFFGNGQKRGERASEKEEDKKRVPRMDRKIREIREGRNGAAATMSVFARVCDTLFATNITLYYNYILKNDFFTRNRRLSEQCYECRTNIMSF